MKSKTFASILLAVVFGLFATGCTTTGDGGSIVDPEFVQGRIANLSYFLVKEAPEDADTVKAASDLFIAFLESDKPISEEAVESILAEASIDEVTTPEAVLLLSELRDYAGLALRNADGGFEDAREWLLAIAHGLSEGVARWRAAGL